VFKDLLNPYFLSNYSCLDKPMMTPSRLVVKFGDPTSATCVACQQACFPLDDSIRNMEASLGTSNINGSTVTWTVNRMTEWDLTPKCFYTTATNDQCCTDLPVTVYKSPESVSFSLNPSGPLTEGSEVTLQCDVQNIAPAGNLTVTFYRGHTLLGQVKSSNPTKEPVNEIFSMSYNSTKEDNGVQFWCEAKLELGAEGPQPPLVTSTASFCNFNFHTVYDISTLVQNSAPLKSVRVVRSSAKFSKNTLCSLTAYFNVETPVNV
uniref:Ig-like domain-containing protein n=1 Tax=Xiphophorus maculatus TaxID=8083 RepID=A0A3B5PTY2_XIPMA